MAFIPIYQTIDFNAKESLGWTLLVKACIDGHKIAFRAIFKHCDIPIQN